MTLKLGAVTAKGADAASVAWRGTTASAPAALSRGAVSSRCGAHAAQPAGPVASWVRLAAVQGFQAAAGSAAAAQLQRWSGLPAVGCKVRCCSIRRAFQDSCASELGPETVLECSVRAADNLVLNVEV